MEKETKNPVKLKESRIGRRPIPIPQGIDVTVAGNLVTVKGKKGVLKQDFDSRYVRVQMKEKSLCVEMLKPETTCRVRQGLYRALFQNMVAGLDKGFSKDLRVIGLGFRAAIEGRQLKMTLGFSHPVVYDIPDGIEIEVGKGKGNEIPMTVRGFDRQLVGQVSAEIRDLRKPEIYKGVGVRYAEEFIKLKPGKKAGK